LSAGYAERGWKRRPRVVTQPARDKAGLR